VLGAQQKGGRSQAGELLGLDLPADPPVRVVGRAQSRDRLAGAGEIIEVAAADGLLDRRLDVQRAIVRGRGAGAAGVRLRFLRRVRLEAVRVRGLVGPVAGGVQPRVLAHRARLRPLAHGGMCRVCIYSKTNTR